MSLPVVRKSANKEIREEYAVVKSSVFSLIPFRARNSGGWSIISKTGLNIIGSVGIGYRQTSLRHDI